MLKIWAFFMVCRAYLTGIYTPIAVWHILGVIPGGRGCPCPCYPYYLCSHSSSSLTPNRTGSVRAMPAAIIRSVFVNMCSSLTTTILYTTTTELSTTIMSSSC